LQVPAFGLAFKKLPSAQDVQAKYYLLAKKLFLWQMAKLISVIDDKKVWAEFVGGK
jgi:hypothetical protein